MVKRNVEENLVKPLVQRENERSKFSRARMPPRERRVRVTQDKPSLDGSGREFYAFAIDVRFGGEWKENDVVGCAYPKGGALFVKLGDAYRRHEILLGTASDPVPGVCVAPKPQT